MELFYLGGVLFVGKGVLYSLCVRESGEASTTKSNLKLIPSESPTVTPATLLEMHRIIRQQTLGTVTEIGKHRLKGNSRRKT